MSDDLDAETNEGSALIAVVDKISSRLSTSEMLVTLAIPIEHASRLSPFLTRIGKHVGVAFADLDGATITPLSTTKTAGAALPRPTSNHPYGGYAKSLYERGIFYSPRLRSELGLSEHVSPEVVARHLAKQFEQESLGDVSPHQLMNWGRERGLRSLFPEPR